MKIDLPQNVREALRAKQKIEAIKLLREQRGIGLKEAKDMVDRFLAQGEIEYTNAGNPLPINNADKKHKIPFLGFLMIAAFTWAMINVVEVIGSVIVMWHHADYHEATFVIDKIHYNDDHEAGLTWGFIGRLPGNEAAVRMYAPRLADAKALGYQKLREMYPAGMRMKVWYNPEVTGTLFQHRTLRVLPHTPDLVKAELAVIYHWIKYCLLPFLGALMLARVLKAR